MSTYSEKDETISDKILCHEGCPIEHFYQIWHKTIFEGTVELYLGGRDINLAPT